MAPFNLFLILKQKALLGTWIISKDFFSFCNEITLSKIFDLDETNWIFDFGNCKEIKAILENQFDHTTCVAADDPELDLFKLMNEKDMIDLRIMKNGVSVEKTSEWIFNTVNNYVIDKTNNRVCVIKVEVWEHEGNSAIYEVN